MADDLADDSFWQRLLGKLKSVVSLRRVGADVQGDSVEAKLARAEAAVERRRPGQGGRAGEVAATADLARHGRLAGARRGASRRPACGRPARGTGRCPAGQRALITMTSATLIWFALAAVAMLGAVWLAERPGTRHRRIPRLAARHQRRRAAGRRRRPDPARHGAVAALSLDRRRAERAARRLGRQPPPQAAIAS